MSVTLALPSKGALYDGTMSLFSRCNLAVSRAGRGRGYWGAIKGLDDIHVQFLRAEEIPLRVDSGDIHMGVTGLDLCQEHSGDSATSHVLIPSLGFGYARLVVAVPKVWIDVESMDDLAEVAAAKKRQHGRAMLVGTKFHRLTRELFANHSIRDYAIVDSPGATEGMPASGAADIVVDLTSSGATLIENDLKEIAGGTAIESEACLVVNADAASWDAAALQTLEHIVESLEAGLRARSRSLIHFTVKASLLKEITAALVSSYHCEVGWEPIVSDATETPADLPVSTNVVCPTRHVYPAVRFLRQSGGASVSVMSPSLMFSDTFDTIARFRQHLN